MLIQTMYFNEKSLYFPKEKKFNEKLGIILHFFANFFIVWLIKDSWNLMSASAFNLS